MDAHALLLDKIVRIHTSLELNELQRDSRKVTKRSPERASPRDPREVGKPHDMMRTRTKDEDEE